MWRANDSNSVAPMLRAHQSYIFIETEKALQPKADSKGRKSAGKFPTEWSNFGLDKAVHLRSSTIARTYRHKNVYNNKFPPFYIKYLNVECELGSFINCETANFSIRTKVSLAESVRCTPSYLNIPGLSMSSFVCWMGKPAYAY